MKILFVSLFFVKEYVKELRVLFEIVISQEWKNQGLKLQLEFF